MISLMRQIVLFDYKREERGKISLSSSLKTFYYESTLTFCVIYILVHGWHLCQSSIFIVASASEVSVQRQEIQRRVNGGGEICEPD